jgi:hypothetical protein
MAKILKQRTELQTIFEFLQRNIATGSMVAAQTGISHKNFTRYKKDLEKAGHLAEIKKDKCAITGFPAWYVTCDKSMFPPNNDLKQ